MLEGVLALRSLAAHSHYHKTWSLDVQSRLFVPPVALGQYALFRREGKLVGGVTWAYLTDEALEGYLSRTRKLIPSDWDAGDQLLFVDFIAPFGGVRAMVRSLAQGPFRGTTGLSARTYGTHTVQKIGRFYGGSTETSGKP